MKDRIKKFYEDNKTVIIIGTLSVVTGSVIYKATTYVYGQRLVSGGVSFGELLDSEGYSSGYGSTIQVNKANGSAVKFDLAMTQEEMKELTKQLTALTKPPKPVAAG